MEEIGFKQLLKDTITNGIKILIIKIKISKIQFKCKHQFKIIGIYPNYKGFNKKNLRVSQCIKCKKIKKKLS